MKPGDVLLYGPSNLYGWIISIKTWHSIAHVEVYIGNGKAVAARGEGVSVYAVRTDGLVEVRRPHFEQPTSTFNVRLALDTFYRKYNGQKYDWLGLIRFAWRARVVPERFDNRQFCSELATRFLRDGWPATEHDIFANEDADAVAPFEFMLTPMLEKVGAAEPALA